MLAISNDIKIDSIRREGTGLPVVWQSINIIGDNRFFSKLFYESSSPSSL